LLLFDTPDHRSAQCHSPGQICLREKICSRNGDVDAESRDWICRELRRAQRAAFAIPRKRAAIHRPWAALTVQQALSR